MGASPGRLYVVWADFIAPSMRHVPPLLRIHDRPCLTLLLDRLRRLSGESSRSIVMVPAHSAWAADLERAGRDAGVSTIAADTDDVLRAVWSCVRGADDVETAAIFPGNAIIPDCALLDRLIRRHEDAAAAVTIPREWPAGLTPLVVIAARVARECQPEDVPPVYRCQDLPAALAAACTRREAPHRRVDYYTPAEEPDIPLDQMPESALVVDEPTRAAAAAALATVPVWGGVGDWRDARAYKHALLRWHAPSPAPAPVRRVARRGAAARPVLFSSLQPAFSGGEESLRTLITGLARTSFRPVTVSPFETHLIAQLEAQRLAVEIAGWDYTTLRPANLAYCAELLETYRPSIVHVDGSANPALMVTAHQRGVPIVFHMRTLPSARLTGLIHLADRIVTVSHAVARALACHDIALDRIVCIHNAVDPERLRLADGARAQLRAERGIPAEARVILMVARLTPSKRIDCLLEALPAILEAVPTAHLVLAGEASGPERAYVAALQQHLRTRGLEARVTWWGFEAHMARLYAVSEVLVHCNPHDALPRCLLEGLSRGLPLVGPNAGGTPEIIQPARNGFLYEVDAIHDLSAAITRLLMDRTLYRRMADGARALAPAFAVTRQVAEIDALYRVLSKT